jgi:hypothetical protein
LDLDTQKKAIDRLKVEDLKKSKKVEDALEKIGLKEVGRKKRLEQKAKDKANNGKGKKTNVQDEVTSIVLDDVLHPRPPSKRGPSGTPLTYL